MERLFTMKPILSVKSTCVVKNCKSNVYRRFLCHKHYWEQRQSGKLTNAYGKPTIDRIMAKVVVDEKSECWNFTGSPNKRYGYLIIDSRKLTRRQISVHRFMYEHFKGKVPDSLYVCHSCDNTKCCNPEHLWAGTQTDNMRDMSRKGRGGKLNGEYIGNAKFTNKEAVIIRKLYDRAIAHGKNTINARRGEKSVVMKLSHIFGVGKHVIYGIVNRKTYKNV